MSDEWEGSINMQFCLNVLDSTKETHPEFLLKCAAKPEFMEIVQKLQNYIEKEIDKSSKAKNRIS